VAFTRRNYEDIQTKSQVLITMLKEPKIDPHLAYIYCNMFPDPEAAYQDSMKYYDEYMKSQANSINDTDTEIKNSTYQSEQKTQEY
jgi:hypothetical protein